MNGFKRFNNKAEVYDKYRPNYPQEAIDIILSNCGLDLTNNIYVADIGSGTGKFTKLLLDKEFIVYGIEPNNDMRNLAKSNFKDYPNFNSIYATAEDTTLEDNSIDLITIAQALHYFNLDKAKEEFKRILKDKSKLALLWNFRAREDPFIQDYEKLIYKFHSKKLEPTFAQDKMNDVLFERFFEKYNIFIIKNNQEFDLDGLWNRTLSSNHSPQPEEKEYLILKEQIKELFEKYQINGKVIFPHNTKIVIGVL